MASTGSDRPSTNFDEYETEPLPLPRRRRLPLLTGLLALAVVAGGAFIGGVEMQKHEGGASASGNADAAAIAARLGRLGRTTTTGGTSTTQRGGSGGGNGGGFGGGATLGTVEAIKGSTLYVTDSSGNTVKVTTSPASSVTKTIDSTVKGINPGDTVVIRGTQGSNGTITAESIAVGGAGAAGVFGRADTGSGATGFGGGNSGGGTSGGGTTTSGSGNGGGGATGSGGGGNNGNNGGATGFGGGGG